MDTARERRENYEEVLQKLQRREKGMGESETQIPIERRKERER